MGNCPSIYVSFGDSTSVSLTPPPPFPVIVFHTYKSAGTFPLEALSVARARRCAPVSKVTTNVSVAGPTVTGIFPLNVATPQHELILEGQHFGSLPGQVLLHLTNYTGTPVDLPLNVIGQWMDTAVAVNIPPVSGVLKQQATLTVITQCGASTTWGTEFTPSNDTALIPYDRITCSISPQGFDASDECQQMGGTNYPPECILAGYGLSLIGLMPAPTGYGAYHSSGWGGGSSGYDQFWPSPSLKNQWVYSHADPGTYVDDEAGGQVTGAGVNASDPTKPVVGINWNVNACGEVGYAADITITGPLGVPY